MKITLTFIIGFLIGSLVIHKLFVTKKAFRNKVRIRIREIITVASIIAAICFSGFQAHFLRRDFVVRNRPYITIKKKSDEHSTKEHEDRLLNSRNRYLIDVGLDEDEKAEFINSPISFTNVGKTPAKIELVECTIGKYDPNTHYTSEILYSIRFHKNEFGVVKRKNVIFPGEHCYYEMKIKQILEPNPLKKDYNKRRKEIYEELKRSIEEKHLFLVVTVEYTFYDEHRIGKPRPYYTRKVWEISPQYKNIETYHYDME
ncbi:MAG: hypothetical protein NG740_00705 [Omnitrophica bacterium]|nr:hypothetical protein [Candidatus Omnitrophota bacterium]